MFRSLREIRSEMKAIFLTEFTTIDAGISRVLAKPLDFDELMPVVEQYSGTAKSN